MDINRYRRILREFAADEGRSGNVPRHGDLDSELASSSEENLGAEKTQFPSKRATVAGDELDSDSELHRHAPAEQAATVPTLQQRENELLKVYHELVELSDRLQEQSKQLCDKEDQLKQWEKALSKREQTVKQSMSLSQFHNNEFEEEALEKSELITKLRRENQRLVGSYEFVRKKNAKLQEELSAMQEQNLALERRLNTATRRLKMLEERISSSSASTVQSASHQHSSLHTTSKPARKPKPQRARPTSAKPSQSVPLKVATSDPADTSSVTPITKGTTPSQYSPSHSAMNIPRYPDELRRTYDVLFELLSAVVRKYVRHSREKHHTPAHDDLHSQSHRATQLKRMVQVASLQQKLVTLLPDVCGMFIEKIVPASDEETLLVYLKFLWNVSELLSLEVSAQSAVEGNKEGIAAGHTSLSTILGEAFPRLVQTLDNLFSVAASRRVRVLALLVDLRLLAGHRDANFIERQIAALKALLNESLHEEPQITQLFLQYGGVKSLLPYVRARNPALTAPATTLLLSMCGEGEHLAKILSQCVSKEWFHCASSALSLGVDEVNNSVCVILQKLSRLRESHELFRRTPDLTLQLQALAKAAQGRDEFLVLNIRSIFQNLGATSNTAN